MSERINISWDTAWFDGMALRIKRQKERADLLLDESELHMKQFESHLRDQVDSICEQSAQNRQQMGIDQGHRVETLLDQMEKVLAGSTDPSSSTRSADADELRRQLAAEREAHSAAETEWQEKCEALKVNANEVNEMRAKLEAALDDLESRKATDAEEDHYTDHPEFRDLQRRFELAVADIRELKQEKAELEQRLCDVTGVDTPNATSWDAEKKRMLSQLEREVAGSDHPDEQDEARLTVEGTIRITDQVVAEKDREITELKALLEHQSTNLEGMAVGAVAIAKMIDEDALIQEERDKAKAVTEQWKEKLRQAEIDISLERAKLARERVVLEEQVNQSDKPVRTYRETTDIATPQQEKKRGWFGFSRKEEY